MLKGGGLFGAGGLLVGREGAAVAIVSVNCLCCLFVLFVCFVFVLCLFCVCLSCLFELLVCVVCLCCLFVVCFVLLGLLTNIHFNSLLMFLFVYARKTNNYFFSNDSHEFY